MDVSLVGYTGFVGSNIAAGMGTGNFYNTVNISDAYGTKPELLIYAGVRAEMFLANTNPDADMRNIEEAEKNIERIAPKRVVLISTVAVYENPYGVTENDEAGTGKTAYGKNRYSLEKWVSENFDRHHIIRLPALFGKNIKKNFLYDYMSFIPSMLNREKYEQLNAMSPVISGYYTDGEDGFYRCRKTDSRDKQILRAAFTQVGFSALNFTDSRSVYQYYDLSLLRQHIEKAVENDIPLLNLTSEPVSVSELYKYLSGKEFVNHLAKQPFNHNVKSIYAELFGGENGYMLKKDEELIRIKNFIECEKSRFE